MAEIIFLAGFGHLVSLANSSGGGGRGISKLISLYVQSGFLSSPNEILHLKKGGGKKTCNFHVCLVFVACLMVVFCHKKRKGINNIRATCCIFPLKKLSIETLWVVFFF